MHPLSVLGDPVRRALIAELAAGEVPSGDLADRVGRRFGIGHPAVSQHLAVLRAAGFAAVRPEGRRRLYRLAPEGFAAAEAWLAQYRPFRSAALDRPGADLDAAAAAAAAEGEAAGARPPAP